MGLLPFKKKKKPVSKQPAANINFNATPTTEISQPPSTDHAVNVVTPATEGSAAAPKWSPLRKMLSAKSPSRDVSHGKPSTGSAPLSTINVAGKDSVEVMTLESQQKLMEQREAIRKKLFESGNDENNNISYDDVYEDDDQFSIYGSSLHTPPRNRQLPSALKRSATDTSQEVLPNGRVQDTIVDKYKSDRFSIPIELVSRSWDTGSLLRIAEAPVDYGVKSRSAGPISVDLSYTESELASVITKRLESEAEIRTNQTESLQSVHDTPVIASQIPDSPDSTTMIPNSPESTLKDASSVAATASTGAVASPANTSRSSIIPMDEKLDELEVQRKLNTGKSPLRGMPDDEQDEYQKDEMESLPISPLRNFALGLSQNVSSFSFLPTHSSKTVTTTTAPLQIDSATDGVDSGFKSTSAAENLNGPEEMKGSIAAQIPNDNVRDPVQPLSCSNVPEVGRAILQKVSECSSGALSNAILTTSGDGKICVDPVDTTLSRGKLSVDESASLTTNYTLRNRPVYLDETSALRFLRRITNNGFVLLYLQPPEVENETDDYNSSIDDWKGRTVTIMIQKGQLSSDIVRGYVNQQQIGNLEYNRSPKLEWTTVTGGLTTEAQTTSIDLLHIQSISTNDDDDIDDDDDLCFFTITSEDGDIHVFETATVEERDRIVNGLKTLIARWSYHVIAGEITATSELFDTNSTSPEKNLSESDDDLPSLPNPHLTMNYVAHMLLDDVI